ncbi:corrinoid activation/regeneration protein AcsV [Haloimpatiens lingqiaonensis]|uniref:corrinoid activation/regeneration protein AcsV n=1 Tax=Haloimpatiens lingqiaonensis TaxID=1380675 RepID=UPI0010FE1BB4|nr:corrinoid activation/regeneration protein AcsV [Haloimpatiens lingqiaonensis]
MAKVNFTSHGVQVEAKNGESLLAVIRGAGIFIDAPCNGNGSCGKCKVKIINGQVNCSKSNHISEEELAQGYVLACCSTVNGDVDVEIPSTADDAMHNMKIEDLGGEKEKIIFKEAIEKLKENGIKLGINIKKSFLQIPEPTLDDNISDVDRLIRQVRNTLGCGNVQCGLSVIKNIPHILRKNNFNITITYIEEENNINIINIEGNDTSNKLYGVAIDIGTTSVAACIINLNSGDIIAKASSGNAQIQYGADVINRIIYAGKKDGIKKLNDAIIKYTINPLLAKMYRESSIESHEIASFVVAGNTTMSHLFLGIQPDYIRMEPYIPAFLSSPYIKANELGVDVNPETTIYLAPSVASYVGGDITAGALASGIWNSEENVLFIDLGTNGEIVFGNREFLMSCACSAGPAFEGGEISCGMRASSGAIEKVEIDKNTYEPKIQIIGEEKPIGICGSGIIDLIYQLMVAKIIDRRGKIVKGLNTPRVRFDEHGMGEYILAFKEEYNIEKNITINEVDIDNFIRAKGAVYSGISSMISSVGMDFDCIDRLYIAGGIGNNLDVESSIMIGMLPDIPRDKVKYIGNSSLIGCYLTIMSKEAKDKLEEISSGITYLELSVEPGYMDEFVSACFLPHTDIERFPTVKQLLGE